MSAIGRHTQFQSMTGTSEARSTSTFPVEDWRNYQTAKTLETRKELSFSPLLLPFLLGLRLELRFLDVHHRLIHASQNGG